MLKKGYVKVKNLEETRLFINLLAIYIFSLFLIRNEFYSICVGIVLYTLIPISSFFRGSLLTALEFSSESLLWNLIYVLNSSSLSLLCMSLILLVSLLINIHRYNLIKARPLCILVILFVCSLTSISEPNIFVLSFSQMSSNSRLSNGLLLIHPILLYLSYSFCFLNLFLVNNLYFIFTSSFIPTKKFVRVKLGSRLIRKNQTQAFFFSSLALLLGSLWAQQEANWGGWWNWDIIEMISLYTCLYTTACLHCSVNRLIKLYKIVNFWPIMFILIYILSRLNIIESIHSFVSSKSVYDYKEIITVFTFRYIVALRSIIYISENKVILEKKNIYNIYTAKYYYNIGIYIVVAFHLWFVSTISLLSNKSYYDLYLLNIISWLLIASLIFFLSVYTYSNTLHKPIGVFFLGLHYNIYIWVNFFFRFLTKTIKFTSKLTFIHMLVIFLFFCSFLVSGSDIVEIQKNTCLQKTTLYLFGFVDETNFFVKSMFNDSFYYFLKKSYNSQNLYSLYNYVHNQNIFSYVSFNKNGIISNNKVVTYQILMNIILYLYISIGVWSLLKYYKKIIM